MKYLLLLLISFFILLGCNDQNNHTMDKSIRVMSYNIKYDNKQEDATGWSQRKDRIVNLISFYQPDFLGTQEGLLNQLEDLESNLDSMKWIGVGRTDGKLEGEFSALFYNARRFELIDDTDSTIWLSKTPAVPSKNWDAALPRIITWSKFRDITHEQEFFVFNTHFDHVGDTARAESAKLILQTIDQVAGDSPVILTGDFNFTPDALPYSILTGTDGLNDSHELALPSHIGPEFTFSGFEVDPDIAKRRIDYIFLSDGITVQKHGAISDFSNGFYPSDHLPVISQIDLQN